MKKLMSKLVAFALVATLAFALTGCFVTPTTTISFNKLPEATYAQNASTEAALEEIIVTLSDNGVDVATGSVAQLAEEGKIVVEGFDLSKTPANYTAKIIFGTAVLTFKYTIVAAGDAITTEADLRSALKVDGASLVTLGGNIELTTGGLIVEAGSNVVLDLDGHTIEAKYTVHEYMVTVEAGAKLEVKGNGSMLNKQLTVKGIFEVAGELVTRDGNFTDYGQTNEEKAVLSGNTINVLEGGLATIYGGTFKSLYDAENVGGVETYAYQMGEVNGEVDFIRDEAGNYIKVDPNAAPVMAYGRCVLRVRQGGSVKVYGGHFENHSTANHAVSTYDSDGDGKKESYWIDGSSYGAYAIISAGDLYFYAGSSYGQRGGFSIGGGSFDVRGGTFTAGGVGSGWACYIAGTYAGTKGVISGGTFANETTSNALCLGNGTPGDGGLCEHVDVVITGGSFKGASASTVQVDGTVATANLQGGRFFNVSWKKNAKAAISGDLVVNGDWTEIVK